jgi:nitroreductase
VSEAATYKTIISKRDTRSFTDQPIAESTLHRVLQAGRMAGSSKNSQPCRFIVVDDVEQKKNIAACGDFAKWVPDSPVPLLIAVAVPDDAPRNEFDAGRAAQNMMVAAWAEELGSCPLSMHHVECARDALGLPANYRVSVVIAFGYRAKAPKSVPEAARKPWDEYVHHNRWQD